MVRKTVIDLEKIESFAALGLTREQVAHNLGFTSRTWQNYNKDGTLEEAYQKGKSKGISVIANALYKKAREGNTTAMIFFLKCNGWKEESSVDLHVKENTQGLQEMTHEEIRAEIAKYEPKGRN